jgi:SpoIID/LytB domain protein
VYASAGKVDAVNELGLESYLQGVVPREMPASWHAQALDAQAVAARSYALATRRTGDIFDEYADTRSQVYGGLAAENAATNAAVGATAGQVLTTTIAGGLTATAEEILSSGSPVALTYFSSTSGGLTAAAQDGIPGATPEPYLVSVDDPYDDISPFHRWGPGDPETDCPGTSPDCVYDAAKMSSLLGVTVRDMSVQRNPSRRVARVTVTTGDGSVAMAGTTMRAKLGLRSTWFSLGLLSLEPARTTITWGEADPLAYRTHGLGAVGLERKRYRRPWAKVQDVRGTAGTITAHPIIKTAYRLRSSLTSGAAILVQVRPRLTLRATSSGLAGTLRPTAVAGTRVALQKRRASGAWVTIATSKAGRSGAFSARMRLSRGAYRARVVPATSTGFVSGASPTLIVS